MDTIITRKKGTPKKRKLTNLRNSSSNTKKENTQSMITTTCCKIGSITATTGVKQGMITENTSTRLRQRCRCSRPLGKSSTNPSQRMPKKISRIKRSKKSFRNLGEDTMTTGKRMLRCSFSSMRSRI